MARNLVIAALVTLVALTSIAPPAGAVADPRFSAISPVMVGTSSGAPTPQVASSKLPATTGFEVDVRDVENAPLLGRTVKLDFSAAPVRLYTQQESGVTIDCAAHTLSEVASLGNLLFHPRFGGFGNTPCVEVTAGGLVLGIVPARSTDMDGLGGSTGIGDLDRFAPLFLAGATNHPEADFDASGGPIDLVDFAIFAHEYIVAAQGTYCP
jgi:hypothetical protein